MSTPESTGTALPDQGEVLRDVAQRLAADRQGPWTSFRYQVRALAPFAQNEVIVTYADGSVKQEGTPRGFSLMIPKLRAAMYRPGAGTWYSGVITVSSAGQMDAEFDYDNEPRWTRPVEPSFYVHDLEKFPRDEAARPEWLRARLSEAFKA